MLSQMKVCVIGLGQIGLPVAQYIQAKGIEVWGYDINPQTVERATATNKFKATSNWQEIPKADVYIVSVTTGQINDCPDISAVFDVSQKISQHAKTSALVS